MAALASTTRWYARIRRIPLFARRRTSVFRVPQWRSMSVRDLFVNPSEIRQAPVHLGASLRSDRLLGERVDAVVQQNHPERVAGTQQQQVLAAHDIETRALSVHRLQRSFGE